MTGKRSRGRRPGRERAAGAKAGPRGAPAVSSRRPLRRLLVANRGEIALRVIRAARDLGIRAIACALPGEMDLPFAQAAGEVVELPEFPGGPREPYLDASGLASLAARIGADAVHPGYGFLSEDHRFARACAEAGLLFIGPPPEALALAGDKVKCREAARRAGVPVLPGAVVTAGDGADLLRTARKVGFPLLIKAAAGGGGRGIRRVAEEGLLAGEAEAASSEAQAAFADGRIYLEREVANPRHVEVQVLADERGHMGLFAERDCSVQRRHQKVIEESPSPAVPPSLRHALQEAAERVALAVGYRNAGTVEFLLDEETGDFFFLEMNARLQVEHPVTEMVSASDLVACQLRIAQGEPLPPELRGAVPASGHAIECRITAETPPGFLPSHGPILLLRAPTGPGVRFDAGYREGNVVGTRYDSLLAKLIAWGPDRPAALGRMERALRETVVLGLDTTVDFLSSCIGHPVFRAGEQTVRFIETCCSGWKAAGADRPLIREIAEGLRRRGPRPAPAGVAPGDRAGPWSGVGPLGVP